MLVRFFQALAIAVFASCGICGQLNAATIIDSAGNSTFATAQDVTSGFDITFDPNVIDSAFRKHVTILGHTSTSSVDFFRFTTGSVGNIIADVDSVPVFTNYDTMIHLFDSVGTPLATSDDNGGDPGDGGGIIGGAFNSKIITGALPAGDYVVAVSRFFSSAGAGGAVSNTSPNGGTYTLQITANAVPEPATFTLFLLGGISALGLTAWRRRTSVQ